MNKLSKLFGDVLVVVGYPLVLMAACVLLTVLIATWG